MDSRFPRLSAFVMITMCMCFGASTVFNVFGGFGEFLYLKDSSGVFHVVQCVL